MTVTVMVWVVCALFWHSQFRFLCVVVVYNLFCPRGSLPSPHSAETRDTPDANHNQRDYLDIKVYRQH